MFDLFNYGDCAIELLQDFQRHKPVALEFDVNQVIDALTPEVTLASGETVVLKYAEYRSISEDIRKQMDKEQRAMSQAANPA